ncbi:restriction endonuclease subunit S [Bifidobacterium adolescentis]|nr:restriction endonuclease subunit S [Bifidobacterium adolescentis]MDB1381075.1 restriction endonuclease subunit S [Bifidobacterium adolescentis]
MAEQHEKALVPQIRFTGFTDPWEQRKLGELFEEHSEKDRDDLPALTIIQGGGTVHRDESNRNLQFDRNSLSNYKVVDTGDFIVHLRSFEGGLEKATCCGLVSPAYHIFRGKNVDSDFYYLYFRSKRFIDADLKPHVYGIRDGRSIDIEGMKTIFIPWTNLAEQRRIGAFFDHLDSLITLHQRKYDKLCVLKKSMLDKMFPKGGSLYPEIRFAGFTDPWEQRKLGDILQERNVRTSDFESNPIFSLTIEDGITPKTDRYERTSLITKTEDLFKIVSPNEFVTNPMNLRFGAFGYNKNSLSVCVSGYYDVFSIDNDKCSGFWNSYFKTPVALKRFDDAATGSLIEKRRVKYSTLCQLIFLMPKGMGEKKQIGAFFDRLDSLITLHQRKLELLRNIKKSMLDKMFV